ncbi:MAG: metal ABC transporter substrate-binding protein [Clostridia bacterium]|nr:metal ABC transporter substrate-binding protein [Clostridia bacterium]
MKKIIALAVIIALSVCGCHSMVSQDVESLVVYASFYPLYALLREIAQGVPDLTVASLTQPNHGCLRDYELTDWDVARLSICDAVFIGGRSLESFEGTLGESDLALFSVMDALALLGEDEQVVEGDDEASHFVGENPWAWLSLDGARGICEAMAAAMSQIDPRYAQVYQDNLTSMLDKIDAMEETMLDAIPDEVNSVCVMHEGMEYLARTLQLEVICEIERESGDDMDSSDIETAVGQIISSGADVVLIEKQAPQQLYDALRKAGLCVALIDTVATSAADYEKAMLYNANAIAAAFYESSSVEDGL